MAGKHRSNSSSGEEIAYRILARREHSSRELATKLRQRNIPAAEIDAIIAKCHRLGFLDDQRWTQLAVREAIRKGKGPVYIRKLLQTNGIDSSDHLSFDQIAEIRRLLAGRLGSKEPRKIWAALLRRGFEPDAIREGLQDCAQNGYNKVEDYDGTH